MLVKPDWKQNIVLIVFSILLIEILTGATLAFVAFGLLLVFFNIKTGRLVRNILAVGVFASYWITYGKLIDPEVGLNFLTSIIVLKILEKETVRDRYMIFFGLLLLISAGSLFERTLTYVLFFGVSFLILIRDFYSYLGQKWRLKDLGLALLWVLPLTLFLFFFIPRLLNPIPFQQGKPEAGEIGYTPDVNITQIESLTGNNEPVFQVLVNKPLKQGDLYWRGNTLSHSDGWNWIKMSQDMETPDVLLGVRPGSFEVKQSFRLFTRADYFFALDFPRVISHGKNNLGLKSLKTLTQSRWNWVPRYEAVSAPGKEISDVDNIDQFTRLHLSKRTKERLVSTFPGSNLEGVQQSIRRHFLRERFSYSLSPGRVGSLNEFLEKKIGFCSHYASSVALIFRAHGIPARLVSGFMGGNYNRFADFYLISQNDAHVWVEAFDGKVWRRYDPTEWIAPDRVRLGGEAYHESIQQGIFKGPKFLKMPKFFQEIKLWFGQWDFLFYQWLEQMDYYSQDAMLTRLKFKREWLFSVIPLMMVIFMVIYSWYLSKKKSSEVENPYQDLWRAFFKKMKKKGIYLSEQSVKASDEMLRKNPDDKILRVWDELLAASFQNTNSSIKDLKKKINQL